jgi:stress-induced morphogen
MSIKQKDLEHLLANTFGEEAVTLKDLAGDGDHYEVTLVSPHFEGLSRVRRHQLVYEALGDLMSAQLHALSIKAYTPQEKENRS